MLALTVSPLIAFPENKMTAAASTMPTQAPRPASLRTGEEYLRSLNDGRAVFFDGERVKNVATHPAFAGAAASSARLFDIAADPAMRERMTVTSPTGAQTLRAYQIPRTPADLRAKRLASETWSEASFGLIGRSPDHVAGFFVGQGRRLAVQTISLCGHVPAI